MILSDLNAVDVFFEFVNFATNKPSRFAFSWTTGTVIVIANTPAHTFDPKVLEPIIYDVGHSNASL